MAKRRLLINPDDQGQFLLQVQGGTVMVRGARPDAAAVLQNVRIVRIRCELEVEADHVTVRTDEPGTPGTPRELTPGQTLQGGGSRVSLEAAVLDSASTPVPDQPMGAAGLEKRLRVIDGANRGQLFPLPESGTVTLGKDRKLANIALNDIYVAKAHCRLEIDGDKVVVVDAGAQGVLGTLVNGKKIARHDLALGDILRIGNTHLRLEAAVPGEEPAKRAAPEADEEEEIEVAVEEEEPVTDEEPAADEEEAEPPPATASEAARLLHAWRHKLGQLSGQAFGHYKLGELIGRGRAGVVFRAEDAKTGQTVALKVFSPQFPQGDEELQRFARVMKTMLPLRHGNLVGLYGAGKTGAYTWVAQELVEGVNLALVIPRLAESRRFDVRRSCRVAIHLARALDFARQHRLRHGRVTPRNILVARRGRVVKLADLMLGAVLEKSHLEQAIQEHRPLSELSYLSPEQADPGAFVDELSDLYGLGAVVYALLTGRPPFIGDSAEEVLEQVRGGTRVARPSALNPDVPAPLEKVVLKMLARRQEDRYQTPAELLADVVPIAAELEARAGR
jgi:hypothetical protein